MEPLHKTKPRRRRPHGHCEAWCCSTCRHCRALQALQNVAKLDRSSSFSLSFVSYSDGLPPKSDGPQPNSNGLQAIGDGLHAAKCTPPLLPIFALVSKATCPNGPVMLRPRLPQDGGLTPQKHCSRKASATPCAMYTPCFSSLVRRLKAIAIRLTAIASRLEAIATRVEAIIASLVVIALRLKAIASRVEGHTNCNSKSHSTEHKTFNLFPLSLSL